MSSLLVGGGKVNAQCILLDKSSVHKIAHDICATCHPLSYEVSPVSSLLETSQTEDAINFVWRTPDINYTADYLLREDKIGSECHLVNVCVPLMIRCG